MRSVAAGDGAGTRVAINPALADALAALSDSGSWAIALDDQWRLVGASDEEAALVPGLQLVMNTFFYGPEAREVFFGGAVGNTIDQSSTEIRQLGAWMLDDFGIGRDALGDMLHPALRGAVAELESADSDWRSWDAPTAHLGGKINVNMLAQRVRDTTGRVVGTVQVYKPAVGTTFVAMLAAGADLDHLDRMRQFSIVDRRPAAVLFADLEGSAQLSKRLSTSAYFAMIRRITKAADECVIEAGGLVGRHVGDGVAAFFAAEVAGSESAAARACIEVARSLQGSMLRIADRHDLPPEDVTVRAGLHWGATLYIGSIITLGRTEVTALGDEVNEAARIEACATGGRALASKTLIERLTTDDAAALGIDPHRLTYTQLADLDSATEKARRDAPAVAVYDISLAT
jgi:class 3 adenylate cyclase